MKVITPNYYNDYHKEIELKIKKITQIGLNYEKNVSLIDKEIAHLILSQEKPITFNVTEDSLTAEEQQLLVKIELKEEDYILSEVRSFFITIIQNRKLPIWKRLLLIRKYANLVDKKIKEATYHKKFIDVLYKNINDKRVLIEIENLPVSIHTKYETLEDLIDRISPKYLENKSYDIMNRKNFQLILENEPRLKAVDKQWQKFIKIQEKILENYIVYYLLTYFIPKASQLGLEEEISFMIIYIVIIQYMMQLAWYRNKRKLSQEEIENIIMEFTKILEQDKQLETKLQQSKFVQTLKDIACCSILLR